MLLGVQRGLLRFIEHPRVLQRSVLLVLLLAAPCLGTGMVLDDYVLGVKAAPQTRISALPAAPLWLFTFTTGDPAQNQALMDEGVLLPWWSETRHLNAFFRPLASLTHVVDFRLWPASSALMHAHSLLWYALLLLGLVYVYRCFETATPRLCSLAFVLFAFDDAHGSTLGWIANRNALVSAALALPALAFHHRAVSQGFRAGFLLAPLCIALGLCGGETAICVVGYLAAYALCLDPRPLALRVASLLPYVLLLALHRALYHVLGLGSFGSLTYHDPLQEPLEFARMLAYNLPVLLSAQLFLPIADLAFWGKASARPALFALAVATLLWFARVGLRQLAGDRMARFWALGMVLAAVPMTASLPGERLLLPLGIGAAPLLARLLLALLTEAGAALTPRQTLLARTLLILHVVAAPLGMPLRAATMVPVRNLSDRFAASLPLTPSVRGQTAVVLNAPVTAFVSYTQVARAFRDEPRPAHLFWLSSASSETRVVRVSERALQVEQRGGFMARPEETLYRGQTAALPPGTKLQLPGLEVRVLTAMPDGRPHRVQFDFAEPLESPRYVFRYYTRRRFLPWQPAPLGGELVLPPEDFFRIAIAELLPLPAAELFMRVTENLPR